MLISANNLNKYFGEVHILKNISFSIEEGLRYGLIGVNGAGKTTLLNVITGELSYESGEVYKANNITIGYLKQNNGLDVSSGIYEEMEKPFYKVKEAENKMHLLEEKMAHISENTAEYKAVLSEYNRLLAFMDSCDGYNVNVKINTILTGMGFSDKAPDTIISTLSGGEKTRLAIAKLLLEEPDLLILDEPTNHLDFKTLSWLEDYLASYKGAILIISHDRYFLDKTVNEIFDLEFGKLVSYKGNYSKYLVLKEERKIRLLKEYERQQEEIKKLQEYVDKNIVRASTSKSAKSRVKTLENMEIIEKPDGETKKMHLNFEITKEPYKDVLKTENLAVSVQDGEKVLINNLNLDIKRGEKLAVIGENGIGKSSFLKTILGIISHYSGNIVWGKNTTVSYYEQENLNLNPEKTALSEIWDRFPNTPEAEIRRALGKVLLTKEEVYKRVKTLSGGEKAKVAFCIIMLESSNVLLLDEPTNHLDLASKEILEKALIEYPGTLIFISHDRYLLNKVPHKIIELTPDGAKFYDGGFDKYMEKQVIMESMLAEEKRAKRLSDAQEKKKPDNGFKTKEQRRVEAARKNRIRELEKLIEEKENLISLIEEEISKPEVFSDFEIMNQKCKCLEDTKCELEAFYEEWSNLSE